MQGWRRQRWRSLGGLVGLLILILGFADQPLAAQANLRLEATAAYDGNYLRGSWLPIEVTLTSEGADLRGELLVGPANSPAPQRLSVELTGGTSRTDTILVSLTEAVDTVEVRFQAEGQVLAEQMVAVRARANERITLLVGTPPPTINLPAREALTSYPFIAVPTAPSDLPRHPAALASVTQILFDGPIQLEPAQRDALWAWLASGGQLFLNGGPDAATTAANLPPLLQPAQVGEPIALDSSEFSAFLASADQPAALNGRQLQPLGGASRTGDPAAPLWVERFVGDGRVTQLAFDVRDPLLQGWSASAMLWDRLLRPRFSFANQITAEIGNSPLRDQALSTNLGNLPPQQLPLSEPLFIALALYTIAIGPGIALLLRRTDRQALGWVVLPGFALLSALLFFGLALVLRADQRVVVQVAMVEHLGEETAAVRAAAAVLNPQRETLTVNPHPNAAIRPLLSGNAAFVPLSSASGPLDQGGNPFPLTVEGWQLQGIRAEGTVTLPAIEARVVFGSEAAQAIVRNTLGVTLTSVAVIYGEYAAELGDLAPGQEVIATWPSPDPSGERPPLGLAPQEVLLAEEIALSQEPGNTISRDLQLRTGLLNAFNSRGPTLARDPGPFVVGFLAQNPLPLMIEADQAARRDLVLFKAQPTIAGSGEFRLPIGWLRLEPPLNSSAVCSGSRGQGVVPAPAPLVADLRLPASMSSFQARDLTVIFNSERQWPNAGVQVEFFNWQTNNWVSIPFDGPGSLIINDAAPLVDQGRARVRLSGRISETGCLFIEAQSRGSLAP